MSSFKGIILLGGMGQRFDDELPKQFHRLSGKKIYLHTLDRFKEAGFFDQIILVVQKDYMQEVKEDVKEDPLVLVVAGGLTRQESSYQGIKAAASADFVMIHDAVRPFVSASILAENKRLVEQFLAVDTCIASFDTIVKSQDGVFIDEIPSRDSFLRGQTPQTFAYDTILEAHEKARCEGFLNATDDCSLLLRQHKKVAIAKGSESNIKITTAQDLYLAEQLMRKAEPLQGALRKNFEGMVFALLGASGGIGQEITKDLRSLGARVIPIGRSSSCYPLDLTQKEMIFPLFDRIYEEFGLLDGFINAAGILTKKKLKELSIEEIERELQVNLHGAIFAAKGVKLKKGGHIINISSSSFAKGRKEMSIYSASKAGLINFSQALAEELHEQRVNVIVPKRTNTLMRLYNFPGEDPSTLLDPALVSKKVIQLLSQDTVTGHIIEVDHESVSH